MYDATTNSFILSDEMQKLQAEKLAAIELQKRKYEDWNENYELYRNKVRLNRLTQRQAVNIPLMKETLKTLLTKIDDPPEIDWKNKQGEEGKEMVYQEIWNDFYKRNKLELIDVMDKKNVLLYGHSVKKLNIDKTGIIVSILDVYDTAFDPLMNLWDLESARFIIQQNIFKSVREIIADDRYSKKGKDELKIWADSSPGLLASQQNKEKWEDKMRRLEQFDVTSKDFPYYAGGDRIVNLTEHYTKEWDGKKFVKRVVTYADDKIELSNETLDSLIGVDFWPFVFWCEDPETVDIYSDSVADLIRTPNKVLNVWFSQMIENRTLKNFQMHWYSPGQNYTAQTYTPGPGVMLPAPPGDDINKVIKPVEISGLEDTLDSINFLTQIIERSSGAVAMDKGQSEPGAETLGEVKILVGKAQQRAVAMSKFYRMAWYEFAKKWDGLMHANAPKLLKLVKIGKSGQLYPKTAMVQDWKSEYGYEPIVRSTSEQEVEETKGLQKWMFILSQFPNNMALRKAGQKRMLELVDINNDELREIEQAEEQAMMAPAQAQGQEQTYAQSVQGTNPQAQPQMSAPQQSEDELNLMNDIQNKINALSV